MTTDKPQTQRRRCKPRAPPKAVRFQSRGPYKCVKVHGRSCQGVHPALKRVLWPHWSYERARKNNTLRSRPAPPAQMVVTTKATRNQRRLPYGKQQGIRFDTQIGSTVKLHTMPTFRVPGRVFYDAAYRDHFIKLKFDTQRCTKVTAHCKKTRCDCLKIKRIRRLCAMLMPEVETAWRFWDEHGFDPVSTQDAVGSALLGIGTKVDVVTRDTEQRYCIFELKHGMETDFYDGSMLGAPYSHLPFSTHIECVLQTLVTHKLYKSTFPDRPMGRPHLMRCDRAGAHVYTPPAWAVQGLPRLMHYLRR